MERRLPLIWFQGIAQGLYLPIFPVWLVGEEPGEREFVVALNNEQMHAWGESADETVVELRRAYAEQGSEQATPPTRVPCAGACRVREPMRPLPAAASGDSSRTAAHIHDDAIGGEPVVTNGIAMCKIHHAAFDSLLMAVRPDVGHRGPTRHPRRRGRADAPSHGAGPTWRTHRAATSASRQAEPGPPRGKVRAVPRSQLTRSHSSRTIWFTSRAPSACTVSSSAVESLVLGVAVLIAGCCPTDRATEHPIGELGQADARSWRQSSVLRSLINSEGAHHSTLDVTSDIRTSTR